MSTAPIRSSRRTFLKQSATLTGAFFLGIQGKSAMAAAGNSPEVTHWVVIQPDDTVVIRIARSELGQGTFTGLAQLVAEESRVCGRERAHAPQEDLERHVDRRQPRHPRLA